MGQQRRRIPVSANEQFMIAVRTLQNLTEPEQSTFEPKRRHQRFLRSLSISVQPLDEDFQPDGELFWLVSRDISLKGIGLVSCDPIQHEYVRVGLLDQNISLIGKVRHNSSIGQQHPLYLVGVEFLSDED